MNEKPRPPMNRRRIAKHTVRELQDVDYWAKLSPEERLYLQQFSLEFYQADFNFDKPLHTAKVQIKECRDRNNAQKRQWHAVGLDLKKQAALEARVRSTRRSGKYYTLDDYGDAPEDALSLEDLDEDNSV